MCRISAALFVTSLPAGVRGVDVFGGFLVLGRTLNCRATYLVQTFFFCWLVVLGRTLNCWAKCLVHMHFFWFLVFGMT